MMSPVKLKYKIQVVMHNNKGEQMNHDTDMGARGGAQINTQRNIIEGPPDSWLIGRLLVNHL